MFGCVHMGPTCHLHIFLDNIQFIPMHVAFIHSSPMISHTTIRGWENKRSI